MTDRCEEGSITLATVTEVDKLVVRQAQRIATSGPEKASQAMSENSPQGLRESR